MNTDTILDFFVEYYIWFIAGGAIIAFAIIGFIVDKNKFFAKKKFPKENTNKKEEKKNKKETNKKEEIKIKESETNNELKMMQNIQNIASEKNELKMMQNIGNIASEKNELKMMQNIHKIYSDDVDDNLQTGENMENQRDEIELEDAITRIDRNLERYDFIYDKYDVDEMNLSKKEKIVAQVNNDDSYNMKISYSQLKEMVEDIIEENQKEKLKDNVNKEPKNKDVEFETNTDLYEQYNNAYLDLNKTAVSDIKQDDEDDVWKF